MEDHSYHSDVLMQRQPMHPAPSPVPYSPRHPFPSHSGNQSHHNAGPSYSSARRHNSATNSETLRRRSTGVNGEEADNGLGFSGLDMPSSSNDDPHMDVNSQNSTPRQQNYSNSKGDHSKSDNLNNSINAHSDHLLPHNYYNNSKVYSNAHAHHRLHQSLNNVTQEPSVSKSSTSPRQRQRQHTKPKLQIQRAHTHSDAQSNRYKTNRNHYYHNDDDNATVASVGSSHTTSKSRRPRSNLTPQHQLDRKNSRRRITQSNSNENTIGQAHVPNRYYLSGKSVQTEWSSPTRQRRSRSTFNHHERQHAQDQQYASHHDKPKSKSSLGEKDDYHNEPTNSDHIIVLPSISIPNNGDEYNRHAHHASQIKPPAFPQRRACVSATSMVCSFGVFKWCVIVQIILVIPLCLYVFDAHAQKKHARQQLQQYNEEHEHILNQMMWMDQAAKKLQANNDNLHHKRTARHDANGDIKYYQDNEYLDSNENPNVNPLDLVLANNQRNGRRSRDDPNNFFESYYADNSATEDLRDSVHKLRGQMRDMQYRIQQNSKARITEKYGEGKIRVYIHPEPEDPVLAAAAAGPVGSPQEMTQEIAMELFIEDTPHAVSIFLYQIERGHWNRVQMNWKSETTILSKPGSAVTSAMGDWMQTSRLEFLEQFPIKHCEVALVQQGQMGVLSLQINLVEVPFQDQEEVCIGRLLNDRLILPKARGYFMAEFSTTSNADSNKANSDKDMAEAANIVVPQAQEQSALPPPQLLLQQGQQAEEETPLLEMTPPPHQPPPPVITDDNQEPRMAIPINENPKGEEVPPPPQQQQPRLRGGRAANEVVNDKEQEEEEEEARQEREAVAPLEEAEERADGF